MNRVSRVLAATLSVLVVLLVLPAAAEAQRHGVPRPPSHPPHSQPAVIVRGQVFIGGYFYDPVFGPYPWWPRTAYPYWYVPVYDRHAEVRLQVKPKAAEQAAVYVDGFYAGIVDDFNNVFQALPLPPGGHSLVLYLPGYRTVRHNLYLQPASTLTLHETMQPLPAGEVSVAPEVVPPVPPPPEGSYRTPVTPPRVSPPVKARETVAGFGTLDVFVQPSDAMVTIDGQPWESSEAGHFIVQVPVGKHHVEVQKTGYRQFTTDLEVREGESSPLNVSLMAGRP